MPTLARVVPPLFVGGLLAGCIGIGCVPPARAPGQPAPEVEGVDSAGRTLRLSDYRGRVVLLSFWHQG